MSPETLITLGDDSGQLLTLDLLLSLVPIVLILGISANAMTGVVNQMQDYVFGYDLQRVVDDAADVLVKTAGDPPNWTKSSPPSIIGLSQYNNTGSDEVKTFYLDYDKILALDDIFNSTMPALLSNNSTSFSYIKFSLKGAAQNTTDDILNWSVGNRSSSSDIFVARRLALYKFEDLLGIYPDMAHSPRNSTCYNGSGANPPQYYMFEFNLTAKDLATFEYWIFAESNGTPEGPNSDWAVDAAPFNVVASQSDCSNYAPFEPANTDQLGDIFPCVGGDNPPGGGSPVCDTITDPPNTFKKVEITSYLAADSANRVIIQVAGDPSIDFDAYFLELREGSDDTEVDPDFTDYAPIFVDLEAGK
jgi:hypothetical protein